MSSPSLTHNLLPASDFAVAFEVSDDDLIEAK